MMMLNYVYLSALIFVIHGAIKNEKSSYIVQNIPKFPFQSGIPFEITISSRDKNIPDNNPLDTMVIQITDPSGTDNEIAVFDIGVKEEIDQKFNGEFMRIPKWEKNNEKGTIYIVIIFTKFAHNQLLEIYHLNAASSKDRRKMLTDLKLASNIYRKLITLFVPSQLELQIDSKTDTEIGLKPNSLVTVSCRAYDGIPKVNPIFINDKTLKIVTNEFDKNTNTIEIKLRVTIFDNQKNLTCQAGNVMKTVKINVYHLPTKVLLEPDVENTLGNNSGIICSALDGYPIPKISWHFVEGPLNSSSYYQISPYNQRLHLKENAIIGSKWKFTCSASNKALGVPGTFNKTISFTIIYKKKNLTESKYNLQSTNGFTMGIDKGNMAQISETKNKINELGLKIQQQNSLITMLKGNVSDQKQEIFNLKLSVSKLKEKQEETNEEINSIKKIVNNEIKNLKNELSKLLIKDKKETLISGNPHRKPTIITPVRKPAVTFDWKVYRLSRLRRKRKLLRSSKFSHRIIRFPIMLFLSFHETDSFRITAHMSQIYDAESTLIIKGSVTLSILNAENQNFQKTSKLFFQRGRRSSNVIFDFYYIDLYQNQVLQSDDVIIRCSLNIE